MPTEDEVQPAADWNLLRGDSLNKLINRIKAQKPKEGRNTTCQETEDGVIINFKPPETRVGGGPFTWRCLQSISSGCKGGFGGFNGADPPDCVANIYAAYSTSTFFEWIRSYFNGQEGDICVWVFAEFQDDLTVSEAYRTDNLCVRSTETCSVGDAVFVSGSGSSATYWDCLGEDPDDNCYRNYDLFDFEGTSCLSWHPPDPNSPLEAYYTSSCGGVGACTTEVDRTDDHISSDCSVPVGGFWYDIYSSLSWTSEGNLSDPVTTAELISGVYSRIMSFPGGSELPEQTYPDCVIGTNGPNSQLNTCCPFGLSSKYDLTNYERNFQVVRSQFQFFYDSATVRRITWQEGLYNITVSEEDCSQVFDGPFYTDRSYDVPAGSTHSPIFTLNEPGHMALIVIENIQSV